MAPPLPEQHKRAVAVSSVCGGKKKKGGENQTARVSSAHSRMDTGSTVVMGVAPDMVIVLLQLRSVVRVVRCL